MTLALVDKKDLAQYTHKILHIHWSNSNIIASFAQ